MGPGARGHNSLGRSPWKAGLREEQRQRQQREMQEKARGRRRGGAGKRNSSSARLLDRNGGSRAPAACEALAPGSGPKAGGRALLQAFLSPPGHHSICPTATLGSPGREPPE